MTAIQNSTRRKHDKENQKNSARTIPTAQVVSLLLCLFPAHWLPLKQERECRHKTLFENKIIHSKGSSNLLWAFSIQSIYLEVGERTELQGITNGMNFTILFLLIKKKVFKSSNRYNHNWK